MLHSLLWHTDGLLGSKLRQLRLGWSNLISYHSSLLAMLNVVNVFPAYLKTWCWICFSAVLTISCQGLVLVFLPYYNSLLAKIFWRGVFFFSKFSSWHMTVFCQTHDLKIKTVYVFIESTWDVSITQFQGTLCKLFS